MFDYRPIRVAGTRLFEYRATGATTGFESGAQVLVIDDGNGLGDFMLARRAVRVIGIRRLACLDVIVEKDEAARVLARMDTSGSGSQDLVRCLNRTAFTGTLYLVGDRCERGSCILASARRLAIDFNVEQVSLHDLDAVLPMTFNGAGGAINPPRAGTFGLP